MENLCRSTARVQSSRFPSQLSLYNDTIDFVGQNPGFLDWQNPAYPPSEGVKVPPKRAKIGHFWLQKGGSPGPPLGGPWGAQKGPKTPFFGASKGVPLDVTLLLRVFMRKLGSDRPIFLGQAPLMRGLGPILGLLGGPRGYFGAPGPYCFLRP